MAIFHLSHAFVKRSQGASSIAKAAYNSGEKIEDNQGSTQFSDYTRKGGVLYAAISLPAGSPAWTDRRGELWRRLEAREDKSTRRKDAVLAHNIDLALPHELTLEQNIFLIKDFIREQFTRKGYAVDWAIHAPDPRGDARNYHAHILIPLRKIAGESFGKKDRYTKAELSQKIKSLRRSWANLVNRHLKRYSHKSCVDERSLRQQGFKRAPTRHHGPRPKSSRYVLNELRTQLPPQPYAPAVTMAKQTGADGSVKLQATIRHTALAKITSVGGNGRVMPLRSAPVSGMGWPKEAVKDWAEWGSGNEMLFFAKWPRLAPASSAHTDNGRPAAMSDDRNKGDGERSHSAVVPAQNLGRYAVLNEARHSNPMAARTPPLSCPEPSDKQELFSMTLTASTQGEPGMDEQQFLIDLVFKPLEPGLRLRPEETQLLLAYIGEILKEVENEEKWISEEEKNPSL